MRISFVAAILIAVTAHGAELVADLPAGRDVDVAFGVAVDDAHLENPMGYFPADEPVTRVVKSITIENIGTVAIDNPQISVNGEAVFPLPFREDVTDPRMLFEQWTERRVHGTNDLDASRQPEAVAGCFGATYCGDDSRALGEIFAARGSEMRFARLNGHSVGEFRLEGDWCLLDGDQNVVYLGWDNRRLCSEAEILADPLLALRAKVFGRQAAWDAAASWQNTSRFEFLDADREQKRFKSKPAPRRAWTFFPRESARIDVDHIPDRVAAATPELQRNLTLRKVAREVTVSGFPGNGKDVSFPLPILSVGQRIPSPDGGGPLFEVISEGQDVVCQIAARQIPILRSGKNVLKLAGGTGEVRVTFDFDDNELSMPSPPQASCDGALCSVDAANADRLWWRIQESGEGSHVAPNLEEVRKFASSFTLGLIDQTFLSADREYEFRAKVRVNGVWSDWSEPARFRVKKPSRPVVVSVEPAPGDTVRLKWKSVSGDMLVFGSNRIDFLPEVFGDREPTRIENGAIRESRENKNLLAVVPGESGQAVLPLRACYRLIAREGNALSVPSELIRLPLGENIPAASVLQNRHEKAEGELVGRDIAVETPLP